MVSYRYIADCIDVQIVHERPQLPMYRVKGDDRDFSRSALPRRVEPSTSQGFSDCTDTTPSTKSPFTKHMQASHQERAVQISPPAPKSSAPTDVSRFVLAPKVKTDWKKSVLKAYPQYKAPVAASDKTPVNTVDKASTYDTGATSLGALEEAVKEARELRDEVSQLRVW